MAIGSVHPNSVRRAEGTGGERGVTLYLSGLIMKKKTPFGRKFHKLLASNPSFTSKLIFSLGGNGSDSPCVLQVVKFSPASLHPFPSFIAIRCKNLISSHRRIANPLSPTFLFKKFILLQLIFIFQLMSSDDK